jgi:hypothetical protein
LLLTQLELQLEDLPVVPLLSVRHVEFATFMVFNPAIDVVVNAAQLSVAQ